jgi:quercetin dioxygenase-like cupin family protein
MTEVYRVLRGVLTLHVDQRTFVLHAGDVLTIEPPAVHWGESDSDDPAWVHVTCYPAFSPEEYVLDPE